MLKVGFFGSDSFSIHCLKELFPLLQNSPRTLSKLDVITRRPKHSGRGMLHLKDVPLATFARSSSLSILRADSNDDFKLLQDQRYDLCIAVSYGKLIPATFLQSLPYGGINVHPSLLPKYSGPAPLQRALLSGDQYTGVTIQTLHPTEFDKGAILSRDKYEIRHDETFESLTKVLAEKGGKLLADILVKRSYDPKSPTYSVLKPVLPFSYAKKVKNSDRLINWQQMNTFDIIRRFNTLGSLYSYKPYHPRKNKHQTLLKRVVLEDITESKVQQLPELLPAGSYDVDSENQQFLLIKTLNGTIKVGATNVEGIGSITGAKMANPPKKMFGTKDRLLVSKL